MSIMKVKLLFIPKSYDLGIKRILKPDLVHVSEGVEVLTWDIESTGDE